jgi:HEPN domain-containing protein
MTSFAKTKVGFAVALLAALFTIFPIVKELNANFTLFGFNITLITIYYIFSFALFISVYLFSIEFITPKASRLSQNLGNWFFAISIIVPLIALFLWILSLIEYALKPYWPPNPDLLSALFLIIQLATIAITLVSSIQLILLSQRKLKEKDLEAQVEQNSIDEETHLSRASQMFKIGYYDLSIYEAYKAIETALQKIARKNEITQQYNRISDLVIRLTQSGIISKETATIINDIKAIRNDVVHSQTYVEKDRAEMMLALTQKVLRIIDSENEIRV